MYVYIYMISKLKKLKVCMYVIYNARNFQDHQSEENKG